MFNWLPRIGLRFYNGTVVSSILLPRINLAGQDFKSSLSCQDVESQTKQDEEPLLTEFQTKQRYAIKQNALYTQLIQTTNEVKQAWDYISML